MEKALAFLLHEVESKTLKSQKSIDNRVHGVESRSRTTVKNKKSIIDNHSVGLRVRILKAGGIDHPYLRPFVKNRHYNVVFWVEPGHEYHTKLTEGLLDPFWNQDGVIFLRDIPADHEYSALFLSLEVQRFNSNNDPGTSTGRVVVGRARIQLPKELYRVKEGSFTLVRADGEGFRPEGYIILAMKLERVKNQDY